jgi:hypothetical protein
MDRVTAVAGSAAVAGTADMAEDAARMLRESSDVKAAAAESLAGEIATFAGWVREAYENGCKVLLFGNGTFSVVVSLILAVTLPLTSFSVRMVTPVVLATSARTCATGVSDAFMVTVLATGISTAHPMAAIRVRIADASKVRLTGLPPIARYHLPYGSYPYLRKNLHASRHDAVSAQQTPQSTSSTAVDQSRRLAHCGIRGSMVRAAAQAAGA